MIKRLLFKITTGLLILVVCYLMGEILLYVFYRHKLPFFPRYVTGVKYNDFSIRGNIPGMKYKHHSLEGEWTFEINKQGFRSDRDYDYQKQDNTLRILSLGDSFAIGFEVGQKETYAKVLERYLNANAINAEVINAGVSGFSNAEELVLYEQEGLKYSPDIIVLGFCHNDFDNNAMADLYTIKNDSLELNTKTYLPAIGLRDFLNSFSFYRWLSENSYTYNFVRTVVSIKIQQLLLKENLDKNISEDNENSKDQYKFDLTFKILERIKKLSIKNGIQVIIVDIPHPRLNVRTLDSFDLSGICDHYINSQEVFKKQKEGKFYREFGHGHWTELSHQLIGEEIGEYILQMQTSRFVN